MDDVDDVGQSATSDLGLEVGQRRAEHAIVVVVDRYRASRCEQLHQLGSGGAVHGDDEPARQRGAAEVEHRDVEVGVALGNRASERRFES